MGENHTNKKKNEIWKHPATYYYIHVLYVYVYNYFTHNIMKCIKKKKDLCIRFNNATPLHDTVSQ